MKNLELIIPKLEEYTYEQKLESDPSTMSYNAGYDVNYEGYDFITGCIDFKKERWLEVYERRQKEKSYFAYIKDCDINGYVGYVNYQYNEKENNYECGVLIEYKYRGKGYAKDALKLLMTEAINEVIKFLFLECGAKTIWAEFLENNPASDKVMQKVKQHLEKEL